MSLCWPEHQRPPVPTRRYCIPTGQGIELLGGEFLGGILIDGGRGLRDDVLLQQRPGSRTIGMEGMGEVVLIQGRQCGVN